MGQGFEWKEFGVRLRERRTGGVEGGFGVGEVSGEAGFGIWLGTGGLERKEELA